jgi:hypothetical protein
MKEGVRQAESTCLSRQIAFQSEAKIYAHIRRLENRKEKKETKIRQKGHI